MLLLLTLFCIGIIGGFLSGLLGFGGAVIIIPLMLTLPSLLGLGEISVKTAAGLSMVQVFFASLSGVIVHKRNRNIRTDALIYTGLPLGICALLSAYLSKDMADERMLCIFALLTISAFLMLLFDSTDEEKQLLTETGVRPFNRVLAIILGCATGTLSGVVGVGGGFIIIPLMTRFLKIPLKNAVGTSLGIVLIGSVLGAAGKILSLQVDPVLVIPLILGSVIASRFGARLSGRAPSALLKYALILVIALSIVQTIFRIMSK